MLLLLDMINEWQSKLDELDRIQKERKNRLRDVIDNPDAELKSQVLHD